MCMCCEPSSKEFTLPHMCCWYVPRHRYFLSKEEEIEILKRYKKELEKEIRGVEQKLQEIKG